MCQTLRRITFSRAGNYKAIYGHLALILQFMNTNPVLRKSTKIRKSMALALSLPWEMAKSLKTLGQYDKRRLQSEALPTNPTCSKMLFETLCPWIQARKTSPTTKELNSFLIFKVLVQMSRALGSFPAKSRHSLYTLQITYNSAFTTPYGNHLFTCAVSLTRL